MAGKTSGSRDSPSPDSGDRKLAKKTQKSTGKRTKQSAPNGGDGIRTNHRSAGNRHTSPTTTTSTTRRDSVRARKRKEEIRRRKRKNNLCAMLQDTIDRVERQPEAESRSLIGRTCRNVSYFVVLFSAVLFLRSSISIYSQGMLHQVQAKYLFAGSQVDLIKGTEMIGFVVTMIFVAVFGHNSHKPLLVTCGVAILATGALIWPVPYFVDATQGGAWSATYGCTRAASGSSSGLNSIPQVPPTVYGQLCQKSRNATTYFEPCSLCLSNSDFLSSRDRPLHVMYLAGFLIGFGTGLFLTTGFLYIEEADRINDTPLFYGFILMMNGVGEFLGSCFVWWFLDYPENPSAASVVLYPWTVRAWWIGMVIFSCLLFVIAFPFLFFPKWITEPSWSVAKRLARLNRLSKMLAAAKRYRQRRREQMKRDKQKKKRGGAVAAAVGGIENGAGPSTVSPSLVPKAVEWNHSDSDGEDETAEAGFEPTNLAEESESGSVAVSVQEVVKPSKGVSFGLSTEPSDTSPSSQMDDRRKTNSVSTASHPSSTSSNKSRSADTRDEVSRVLTDFFSALWSLISIPTYLLTVVSVTLSAYLPGGYRTELVRFVETQYFYDVASASFYADGLCYPLAQAFGPIVCGCIIWRLKLSLSQQLKMIIYFLAANIFLFFLLFSVGCPSGMAGGQWQSAMGASCGAVSGSNPSPSQCCKDCDCSAVQLEPVCSPDGARYLSPCHAGCTQLSIKNSSLVYSSCSCLSGGTASAIYCSQCSVFGAFWVLLFLAVLAHSMAYVCVLLIFLRIVAQEKRQLSLSFAVWIVAVAVFVPGTAVFRGIADSACLLWKSDCYSESYCWFSDLSKYRYVIHGSNIVFQGVAMIGFILVLFVRGELKPCQKTTTSTDSSSPLSTSSRLPDGGSDGAAKRSGVSTSNLVMLENDDIALHMENRMNSSSGRYNNSFFQMEDEETENRLRGNWLEHETGLYENQVGIFSSENPNVQLRIENDKAAVMSGESSL